MRVNVIEPEQLQIRPYELTEKYGRYQLEAVAGPVCEEDVFLSPPWIDSHVHCFYAVTSFGLKPDEIGYKQGVHLLVDAGSAGAETFQAFREFIVEKSRTKVKAFLNVSSIGHVTMREYYDMRLVDVERAAKTVMENRDILLGIKVRSSGIIVEERGLWPLQQGVKAAEMAGCPLMVHLGENPPSNEENLALLRGGDIASHCFHGKEKPLWQEDGSPIPALEAALQRGLALDVAHGAASFDRNIAVNAMEKGFDDFTISTDLHIRNVNGPVYSLADTMSKFLALGMPLAKVIRSVSSLPARWLGLSSWGSDLTSDATFFRLQPVEPETTVFTDSVKQRIDVKKRIVPVAVLMDGKLQVLEG